MARVSFKTIRVSLLLAVLAIVAIYTNEQRYSSQSWKDPLEVVIFPINAEGSEATERFIRSWLMKISQRLIDLPRESVKSITSVHQCQRLRVSAHK